MVDFFLIIHYLLYLLQHLVHEAQRNKDIGNTNFMNKAPEVSGEKVSIYIFQFYTWNLPIAADKGIFTRMSRKAPINLR